MVFKSGEIFGRIIKHYPNGLVDIDYDGTIVTLPETDNELQGVEFAKGGSAETKQMDLFEQLADSKPIDKVVEKLNEKYVESTNIITDYPVKETTEEKTMKRNEVIEWIKRPDVNLIIAFSGGKDSVAMVLYCLFVLKIPKERIELWHHDVDGGGEKLFDWACTQSYCEAFAKEFDLKLLFSYADGGILREMYRRNETIQPVYFQKEPNGAYSKLEPRGLPKDYNTRMKFPMVGSDMNARWCSGVAKISVMRKAINNWDKYDNAKICIMTGERRLESVTRSTYNEVEIGANQSASRQVIQWRPIIDWTEEQIWDIFKEHKVQPHPCYELGWGRCSCQLCIFSTKNIWAGINEISPEKVKRIAEIEQDFKVQGKEIIEDEKKHGVREGKKPFIYMPYLYGDKDMEEKLIPAHTRVTKSGKVQRVKEKVGKVWTGEYLNIYEGKVNQGVSIVNQEAKKRWLAEALSTFKSPIIVKEWKLPAGAFSKETSGAS